MKKVSIFRLCVTLLLISGIIAGALAGVNAVTAPKIAELMEQKTQQAISAVLPGGGEKIESYPDETGIVTAVYASEKGHAVEVTPAGFDGAITMMVGIDAEGKVLGVEIVSHTETAGLGAVAADSTAAGKAFRQQFTGTSGTLAVTKDGGSIDAITSATITSRAVTQGVNAALACVAAMQIGGAK